MKNLKIINQNELKDWADEIFKKNSFNMVNVSSKKENFRRALASGKIYVGKEVFELIKNKEIGSSNCNLAVTVIDLDIQNARLNVTPVPDEFCLPGNFVLADSSINVQSYTVDWGDGSVQSYAGSIGPYQYTLPGSYLVNVIGQDTVCDTWDTTTFEIQVNPAFDSVWIDYDYDFCDPLRLFKASVRHVSDSSLATDYVVDWNLAGATYGTSSVQVTLPTSGANRITAGIFPVLCSSKH